MIVDRIPTIGDDQIRETVDMRITRFWALKLLFAKENNDWMRKLVRRKREKKGNL